MGELHTMVSLHAKAWIAELVLIVVSRDYWYVDALATDAIDAESLYLLVGAYTNSWSVKTID